MSLRLASVQEQIWIPLELVDIGILVQLRTAAGLKCNELFVANRVSVPARPLATGLGLLISVRKSAQHREINIEWKRKEYSLSLQRSQPVMVVAFSQQFAVCNSVHLGGIDCAVLNKEVIAEVVPNLPQLRDHIGD